MRQSSIALIQISKKKACPETLCDWLWLGGDRASNRQGPWVEIRRIVEEHNGNVYLLIV